MAKKLTFSEFDAALESRRMPVDKLADYVEFDKDWPIPRLVFRPDALLDQPPPTYDLDSKIYQMLQDLKLLRAREAAMFSYLPRKSIVAEGDSWFNLPPLLRPPAIADWIEENGRFQMKNIARWGDTLELILKKQQYLSAISEENADYFMISAGGNDLQLGLASGTYLHDYEANRPFNAYLTDIGDQGILDIARGYRRLLDQVTNNHPNLKILCYGYDYPRPLVEGGQFIGRYLRKHGIPDSVMTSIIVPIIDKLNLEIQSVTANYQKVTFLNCLGVTEPYTWYDDMHPDSEGFLALSMKFEEAMTG